MARGATAGDQRTQSAPPPAPRELAPWSTSVDRKWYAAGGREVAAGAKLAKSDDWKGAEKAWREGRKTAEGDAKGRVIYDLAVAAERRGDIATALKLVKEAKTLLHNTKRADAYQAALRDRKREAATLRRADGTAARRGVT